MSRLSRRKRNHEAALPTISLTPLIDTILVLLVIFMVTTPGKVPTAAPVDHVKKMQNKTMAVSVIEINRQGDLYLDGQPMSYNSMIERIQTLVESVARSKIVASFESPSDENAVKNVFVHPHEGAPSETVALVLNGLRRLSHVGIMVG